MDILLQVLGGLFYLINKIFFSLSETKIDNKKNQFQLFAWLAYIIGVPAWIVLLIGQNNWIAVSVEAGGIPAMLLGLYKVLNKNKIHTKIEKYVKYITSIAIVFGISLSFQYHGGITSLSQILEIGVTIGFLIGTYLMTQNNHNGYIFFMLMNLSMASLMLLQDKHILAIQQIVSLLFVIYGYIKSKANKTGLL